MEDKVCDFVYTRTDNYLSLTKIASLFAVAFLRVFFQKSRQTILKIFWKGIEKDGNL